MQDWIKVSLLLCAFGTLREIRPSEPFVSEFLLGEWRNITEEQLNREVYPLGTYSYLVLLVLVFLITDFLRFKPVIILSGLSGIVVYSILLWTTSLEWLQASQFFYGLYIATEVAYLTYIYAKVDSSKYPVVSSYTRVAALAGRFLSGVSAQVLTLTGLMDYRQLNYITLTAQILATFWAFWLPSVQFGIYFHRRESLITNVQLNVNNAPLDKKQHLQPAEKPHKPPKSSTREAVTLLARHAYAAYSRADVVAWSLLYAAALGLFVQVQTYVQLLWKQIQDQSDGQEVAYNGAVEAAQTLLGAGGALLASRVSRGETPAAGAAVQAVAVFLAAHTSSVYLSYAGYIVMGILYHYIITLASAKIASRLSDDSCFGLIFGINTLVGTGLQSLLTLILIQVLELQITTQYYSLSVMYLVLSCCWLLGWIVHSCKQKVKMEINSNL